MDHLQAQYEDQCGEEGGLLLTAAMMVLVMIAILQKLFSREKKIWHKLVSRKDGAAFIQKKAKKYRITMTAWKIWAGDGSKRYDAVFLVHRGERTWCLYGSRDDWDLTNDAEIAARLWRQANELLSEQECRELLS